MTYAQWIAEINNDKNEGVRELMINKDYII